MIEAQLLPRYPKRITVSDGLTKTESNGTIALGFDYENSEFGAELAQAVDAAETQVGLAEDAVTAAEAARDVAIAAAGESLLNFQTVAAATIDFPSGITQIKILAYDQYYSRVAAEPDHEGKFRSLDRYLADGTTVSSLNGGWWEVSGKTINPQAFGVSTASADNTEAWGFLEAYLQGRVDDDLILPQVRVPAGTYVHTGQFPNFAFNWLSMVPDGEVRLRYTGTGHDAVWLDGTSRTVDGWNGCWGLEWGNFIIEATANALAGLRVSLVHHSRIWCRVKGAGPSSAGLVTEACVCSDFWPVVSGNEVGDWYTGAAPLQGVLVDRTSGVNWTAYCTFHSPVCENTAYGIYFNFAIGNTVIGGTAEGCTSVGVYFDDPSLQNEVYRTDLETNTTADVFISGTDNRIISVDTHALAVISADAIDAKIDGGLHGAITVTAGALRTQLSNLKYNRGDDSSTIADSGDETRIINVVNAGTEELEGDVGTLPVEWTPALAFGGVSTGITYGSRSARLYQMGKLTVAFVTITLTSKGSATGAATISGLPFAAVNANGGFQVAYAENLSVTGALAGIVTVNTGVLSLMQSNSTGVTPMLDTNFTNTSRITGTIIFPSA